MNIISVETAQGAINMYRFLVWYFLINWKMAHFVKILMTGKSYAMCEQNLKMTFS